MLLEVWGWQLLGMGLPVPALAASREDQHRVPAWWVPVPLLATLGWHHDSLFAVSLLFGVKHAHLAEPQLEWVMPAQLGTAIALARARDTPWFPG